MSFNSSLVKSSWSVTHSMIEAEFSLSYVRCIPSCSILSLVFLMPAVSIKRNVMPWMVVVSSITSRVVPCISLTMARFSPTNWLSKVLFPTLVLPTIATGTPSFMALPDANELQSRSMCLLISSAKANSASRSANSNSS